MRDGTLWIQRTYPGVGRIMKRSGTRSKKVLSRLHATLDTLKDRGRLDLLESVRNGTLTAMQLHDAQSRGELDSLPSAAELIPLKPGLFDWLDGYGIAETTRRGYRDRFNQILKLGPDSPKVSDLPMLLGRMREKQKKLGQFRSFNQARSAVQAYLRNKFSRKNRLYVDVSNLEPFPSKPKRKGNPLSVVDALAIRDKMPPELGAMWWTCCLTGMGPREYWGVWEIMGETVAIHGEKREGRDRVIPKLGELVRPTQPYKPFRKAIRSASKRTVQPYDARRTFARLLAEAEVWPIHRSCYMGHGAKSLADYYGTPRMAEKMLEADRKRVLDYLKQESRKRVNPLAAQFFHMEE